MTLEDLHRAFADVVGEHHGSAGRQDFFRAMHRQALKGMGMAYDARIQESGERGAIRFVASELARRGVVNSVVFDVGANVGHYADAVLDIMEDAVVWSFEPSPTAFRALVEAASRHSDRRRLFNIGFSDAAAERTLFADRPGSGLGSLYNRQLSAFQDGTGARETARLETIDAFCAENGVQRIHFLKLDVEGHETAVLRGARGMLDRRAIDFVQFEFGGCAIDSRSFLRDFWGLLDGFAICRILKDGLYRFAAYDELDEIFAYQNFLAIRE